MGPVEYRGLALPCRAGPRQPYDARAHVEAVQIVCRQFDDRRAIAVSFELLGMIALHDGDLAEARRLGQTAVRQLSEIGLLNLKSRALLLLGDIALAEGNAEEARRYFDTAVTEANLSDDKTAIDQAQARLDGLAQG